MSNYNVEPTPTVGQFASDEEAEVRLWLRSNASDFVARASKQHLLLAAESLRVEYAEPHISFAHAKRLLFQSQAMLDLARSAKDARGGRHVVRILSLLKSRLPERPVIFDIGASNGEWTRHATQVFPAADYHLFEPQWAVSNVYHDAEFKALLSSSHSVKTYPTAIGQSMGNTVLHVTPHPTGSTTLDWKAAESLSTDSVVPINTLDAMAQEQGLPQPHLIKMDIQGGELNALRGAEAILPNTLAIMMETWTQREYGDHTPVLSEIIGYLSPFGFRLFDLGDQYRHPDGTMYAVDACFVRDSSQKKLRIRVMPGVCADSF